MYMLPRKFICKKCGFEIEYSRDTHFHFLPIDSETEHPYCYQCLIKFIAKNVPLMELV